MAINFNRRSTEKELIDYPADKTEIVKNLKELDTFNKITGNNLVVLKKIENLITDRNKKYHLADLGCGGGQFLLDAYEYAKKHNLNLKLTGVDNNNIAGNYFKERIKNIPEIISIESDYKNFLNENTTGIDFIYSSLFCHHLNNEELLELINQASELKATLIINDLLRSKAAYYAAKLLTTLFRGTRLARNDGPLSVLRAFTEKEITDLTIKANSCSSFFYRISFFRFLLIIKP